MAVALRAVNQALLVLTFEIAGALEPAFEAMLVIADEVVDDHRYVFGARDGTRTRTARGREILSLLCLPIPPPGPVHRIIDAPIRKRESAVLSLCLFGAGDESRTRDLNLGKVALYQLSYSRRIPGGASRSRTDLHGFAIRCITALLSRPA